MGRILRRSGIVRWLPWTIFLSGLSGTLLLWGGLVKQQRQGVLDTIIAEFRTVEHEFETLLGAKISDLQREALIWAEHGKPSPQRWETSARALVNDHHGLEAVCTATPDGRLASVDASTLPAQALSNLIAAEGEALERCRKTGRITVVKLPDPETQGHGFVVNVPVGVGDQFQSFILGLFHFDNLMHTVLDNNTKDLDIKIADGPQVVYQNCTTSTSFRPLRRPLEIFGSKWTMYCRPTPALLARETSRVVNLVLVIGAVVSWLLAISAGLMIKVRLRESVILQRKQELAFYSAVVRNSQDAIITTTLYGEITKWNDAAETLYGFTAEEAIGQHISIIDPPNRSIDEDERFSRVSQGEWVPSFDAERQHKDGTILSVSLNESPVVLHGEIVAVSNISRDIGERRATEKRLAKNARLLANTNAALNAAFSEAATAARAKSRFLANVSHEIRSPLTAILGYAELAAEFVQEPQAVEAIATIKRNGDHLLTILNDILDLTKIEADEIDITIEPTNVAELARDVVQLMNVRAAAKSLPLTLEFTTPFPRYVPTDATRLRQVLINLIANAIKFTERGSVRLTVSYEARQNTLFLAVSDTGIGMNEEQIKSVFTPFNQADNSTTRQHGGTGLGLAISKRLTKMLGGKIEVTSDENEGSCFTISLPLPQDADVELLVAEPPSTLGSTEEEVEQDRGQLQGCRVLLAEDGIDNQRLFALILRKAGAEVTVVEDGKRALDLGIGSMPQNRRRAGDPLESFHVILMDMQMPVMDGYTATQKLREYGYDQPIVALTAHGMRGDREKCLAAGCDDYAKKPIKAHELVALVAECVRTGRSHANERTSDRDPQVATRS